MQCTCHKVLVRGMQTYQSGERMTGSHEVSGSIPLISTKKRDMLKRMSLFYHLRLAAPDREQLEKSACILLVQLLT